MSDVIPFPIPGRFETDLVVCRGAGAADAAPATSGRARRNRKGGYLSPAEKVSTAYRFVWRGAWRCRAGDDVGAGYRLVVRAAISGLFHFVGPARANAFVTCILVEQNSRLGAGNDDGPEAA